MSCVRFAQYEHSVSFAQVSCLQFLLVLALEPALTLTWFAWTDCIVISLAARVTGGHLHWTFHAQNHHLIFCRRAAARLRTDTRSVSCRHRATRLCIEAAQNLMKACGGDLQFEGPGWNSCTVDMIRVAKAHSMLVLHQTFADAVEKLQRAVRESCRDLIKAYGMICHYNTAACSMSDLICVCLHIREGSIMHPDCFDFDR